MYILSGLDESVSHEQSESMKELFRGIGVRDAKVRLFPVGHWGIVTCMCSNLNNVFITSACEPDCLYSLNVWNGWTN